MFFLSIYLSVLPLLHPYIYLSTYLSVYPFLPSISLFHPSFLSFFLFFISINLSRSIWLIDGAPKGSTTPDQSRPGSNEILSCFYCHCILSWNIVLLFSIVGFGLVWFFGISILVGYLMPNPSYTYILNIWFLNTFCW